MDDSKKKSEKISKIGANLPQSCIRIRVTKFF